VTISLQGMAGQAFTSSVTSIARDVWEDPETKTRSIRAEGLLENPDRSVRPGLIGTATFAGLSRSYFDRFF
jgi:hypothetical protein